jgi:hypothetical protein
MTLADEIEELVLQTPGLTEADLARMLRGPDSYIPQIKFTCRHLVAEGRLERQGRGGWQQPFKYYPPTIKSRAAK